MDIVLLGLLAVIALALIRLRSLFAVVMLSGIYSFVSATLFVVLDAVDVAFTEAAVGAGVSTVLMLATLALTTARERSPPGHRPWLPLLVVVAIGAALIYATFDMPPIGRPDNPAQVHVAPRYIQDSPREIGIPNMVTSVLASYRGFDTLGEVVVIFTAAVGVLILIGRRRDGDEP